MLLDGRFQISGITRKTFALMLASCCTNSGLHADEGFIKQPKLQKANTAVVERAAEAPQPAIQNSPRSLDLGQPNLNQPNLNQPNLNQPNLNQTYLNQPSSTGKLEVQPITFRQPPESGNEGALRWVSRGSGSNYPPSMPSLQTESASARNRTVQTPLVINLPNPQASQVQQPVPEEAEVMALQPTGVSEPPAEATGRAELAASISSQIMASGYHLNNLPVTGQTVDDWPGWQAVGERLSHHMQQCEGLLGRNAFLSAQEEAEQGVLHLVRVLDWMNKQSRCEPAWHVAQQALKEADDFATAQRLASDKSILRRIIESHQTPTLKNVDVQGLAPMAAAQLYREFAQQKLVEASQGHPWASEIYYSLGRCSQAQADSGVEGQESLRWCAVAYYRSAQVIDPKNSLASNQLGYILLQMDRPSDAAQALIASYNAGANPACLRNLIEASRRLGDQSTQQWATQNLFALESNLPQGPAVPMVTEIDVQSFAAISPITVGPSPRTAAAMSNGAGPIQR